jgi:hypothetical protein
VKEEKKRRCLDERNEKENEWKRKEKKNMNEAEAMFIVN